YNHEQKQGRITVDSIKLLLQETWVSITTFVSLTSLYLLMAKKASGQAYIFELRELVEPRPIMEALGYLLSYMTNFQKFSSFIYDSSKFRLLNIPFSLLICCYGLFFIAKTHKKAVKPLLPLKVLLTLLAFIANIFVLLLMRNAWTGHHFVYPYVFGLIAVCQSILYNIKRNGHFLILYSFFSILLVIQLLVLETAPYSSWERYKIFDYLKQEIIAK